MSSIVLHKKFRCCSLIIIFTPTNCYYPLLWKKKKGVKWLRFHQYLRDASYSLTFAQNEKILLSDESSINYWKLALKYFTNVYSLNSNPSLFFPASWTAIQFSYYLRHLKTGQNLLQVKMFICSFYFYESFHHNFGITLRQSFHILEKDSDLLNHFIIIIIIYMY